MRKILFIWVCFIPIVHSVSAQSLYNLWRKAGKEMVKYSIYYSGPYDFQLDSELPKLKYDKHKGRWTPPLKHRKEYRHISEEITRLGFDYNHQNDTLLFVFYHLYEWPSLFYVYSSQQKNGYKVNSRTNDVIKKISPDNPRTDQTEGLMYVNECLYEGNIKKLVNYFRVQGYAMGGPKGFAWRIIIRNGKIIYPSYFWEWKNGVAV